jgi:hypothetical protein
LSRRGLRDEFDLSDRHVEICSLSSWVVPSTVMQGFMLCSQVGLYANFTSQSSPEPINPRQFLAYSLSVGNSRASPSEDTCDTLMGVLNQP